MSFSLRSKSQEMKNRSHMKDRSHISSAIEKKTRTIEDDPLYRRRDMSPRTRSVSSAQSSSAIEKTSSGPSHSSPAVMDPKIDASTFGTDLARDREGPPVEKCGKTSPSKMLRRTRSGNTN